MTHAARLARLRTILTEAVLAGATQVVRVRLGSLAARRYKARGELVTLADERSDAAMSAVFERRLAAFAPAIGWHLEESALARLAA